MQVKSNWLRRIFSISLNTFRETVRDRVLYNLVFFVLLITASAIFLGDLTAGNEARVIVNLGLSSVLLFGAFIAIFVGVGLVSKEIERRTIYSIFAKPIGRGEFLVGKYVGLCLTLLVNVLVMAVGISLALAYVGGNSLITSVWYAVLLIYFELTILTAVAFVFSSFSSPMLSSFLTFLIFIIGHFSSALKQLAESLGTNAAKFFFNALYYLLPNLSFFSFATNAAHGECPAPAYLGTAFLYGIVYVVILLLISTFIFSKRNFK